MKKAIGIVLFLVFVGIFSLSSAHPIQASINENRTDVFLKIVNLDPEKTINGYVVLDLGESSKIRNFSVAPKTAKVVASIKKPERKEIAIAQIFLDENQGQIVLTRPITFSEKKKTLPVFISSQNYNLMIIAVIVGIVVIGVIALIGVFILIKIRNQPPGQW